MFIQKIADTTGNAGRTKGGKGKGKREGTMSVVKKKKKKERKKENKRRKGRKKKKGSDGKEVLSLPFPLSLSLCVSFSFPSLLHRYSLSAGVKSVEMRRRWECGLCDSRERRWSKNRNSGGL